MLLLLAALLAPGWLADDFDGALAAAQAKKRPVIVDLWAPWCHTCLSMQQTVLQDPRITARKDDFIWVALDTDRPKNAAALARLKPAAWPTFYRLAPDGAVVARHAGAATVEEFLAFLGAPAQPADAAAAAGAIDAAAAGYAAAIDAAPGSPDAVRWRVARIGLLRKAKRFAECAGFGLAELGKVGQNRSAAAADFSWYAHDCAGQSKDEALARRVRTALIAPDAPLRAILADPARLSVDDQSDALRILREIQHALGEIAAARASAEAQWQLIHAHWTATTDPRVHMMLSWPLVEVAVYLGRGAEARPLVEATVRALPAEYDPSYRLAWLLHQTGAHDAAVAPAAQARARVYGPRAARVATLQAQIHAARRDRPAALEAARDALALVSDEPERAAAAKALVAEIERLAP